MKTNGTSSNHSSVSNMKHIDLFAGTGAFTYALNKHGVETVYANDMLESSKTMYDENFNHKLTQKNLLDIDVSEIPKHDILTGGFPCQPFSIAGKQEGFQDARSNVFWKILEIIDHHTTPVVILENVKNLVSHDEHRTFQTILEEFNKRNYYVHYKVLNTSKITGVPQNRERIYICAFKSESLYKSFSLDFPILQKSNITDFLEESVPDKYYYTEKSGAWKLLAEVDMKPNTVYQYRRVYVRENKSGECPTLTANMGSGGHNVPIVLDSIGKRKLTPRECFNLQGFPPTFKLPKLSDAKLYSLAGNAVSVPVVCLIADRLCSLLNES